MKLVEVVSDEINESTNTDYYARLVGNSRNVRSDDFSSEGLSLQNPPLGLSTFQTQILSQIPPQVLFLLTVSPLPVDSKIASYVKGAFPLPFSMVLLAQSSASLRGTGAILL